MPKADEKEKKPAEEKKPMPEKPKYVVNGGNIKYQKVWYKEGQSLQLTDEEFDKLPGPVKEKLKKGGE
jgi:hypothetical protein